MHIKGKGLMVTHFLIGYNDHVTDARARRVSIGSVSDQSQSSGVTDLSAEDLMNQKNHLVERAVTRESHLCEDAADSDANSEIVEKPCLHSSICRLL